MEGQESEEVGLLGLRVSEIQVFSVGSEADNVQDEFIYG